MDSTFASSIYCKDAREAACILGLPSHHALYRKLTEGQFESVVHLVKKGLTANGNKRKGRYFFERARLRLRPTPLPQRQDDDDWMRNPENPANWDRLNL